MADEFDKLIELFCENGGSIENMSIGYREESGYFCSVIDNQSNAAIFCPTHLLVDVDDIGINEQGLFVAKPENYTNNISFLEKYFSFHFDEKLVVSFLEEKRHLDSLSENEKRLLGKINFPDVIDDMDNNLEYVKYRILHSHQMIHKSSNKKVIMPFVTFLNHDMDGTDFDSNKNGITVSGKFNGEVFAHYHMGDVLMMLKGYGFVTDTMFVYSLPMWIKYPNGIVLKIDRDIKKFKIIDGSFRWPIVEKNDNVVSVSWFPMYFQRGPRYPIRIAATLARDFNIPAEDVIYQIFRFNLNALLPIVFSLKDSDNSYIQKVVTGVERQLELIGGCS